MESKKIIFIFFITNFLITKWPVFGMNQEAINLENIYKNQEDKENTSNKYNSINLPNTKNIQDLQNIFNLNDYGIKIFELKFDKKINKIKIKDNFLIIRFSDRSKLLIDLESKETIFNNAKSLVLSNNVKFLFVAIRKTPSNLIDLNTKKIIIQFNKPKPSSVIFSNNNKYFLVIYRSTPDRLAYLFYIPEKKIIMKFADVIKASFTKNSTFLFILHRFRSELINLKKLEPVGNFFGLATLSNTGKFLYGKMRSDLIFSLFDIANPFSIKTVDFSSPYTPKLVNLETMKILKKFKRWGMVNFSENDKFLFVCNLEGGNQNKDQKEEDLYNAELVNLEKKKTIRQFHGSCTPKFNKQETLAVILTANKSKFNVNSAELIDTQTGKTLQSFENISINSPKFSHDSKFLKLTFTDNLKKIIDIKENCTVLAINKNKELYENLDENCGLTGNFAWHQDKNNTLKIIKLSTEIKLFRKNLLDKYNKKDVTKHNYFSDTRIKTLS